MNKKYKIIIFIVVIAMILIGSYLILLKPDIGTGEIIPPKTQNLKNSVDLYKPEEGTITITSPITDEDDIIMINKNLKIAIDAVEDQYEIPYEDPADIPTEKENRQFTSTYKFYAKDEYKLIWNVVTFNSTWYQLYKQADFTIIIPEGYNVSTINTNSPYKPTKELKDNRWHIGIQSLPNQHLKIGITYIKQTS